MPKSFSEGPDAPEPVDDAFSNGFAHTPDIRFSRMSVNVVDVRPMDHLGDMGITDQIRALRERAGLSMAAMARACGWKTASSYQRYEDPDTFKRTRLHPEIAERMAVALVGKGVPPITREEVMALASPVDFSPISRIPSMRAVEVVGVVEAGAWREAYEIPKEDRQVFPLPPLPGYERIEVFALEVRGTSMNRVYPEGSIAYFVRIQDSEPVDGSIVVVVSKKGGLYETTLKILGTDSVGRRVLKPDSTDPRHQKAIYPDMTGADAVEIIGVAVGKFEMIPQPLAARRPKT